MGKVTLKQGNIFHYVKDYDLSIVAGHIGLNEMNIHWIEFRRGYPELKKIRDPFNEICNKFIQLSNSNKYIFFMPSEENNGISDESLIKKLSDIFSYAINRGIKSIIFNGLNDVDHGHDTFLNRKSNEKRVNLIFDFVKNNKETFNEICLITLGDDFIKLR